MDKITYKKLKITSNKETEKILNVISIYFSIIKDEYGVTLNPDDIEISFYPLINNRELNLSLLKTEENPENLERYKTIPKYRYIEYENETIKIFFELHNTKYNFEKYQNSNKKIYRISNGKLEPFTFKINNNLLYSLIIEIYPFKEKNILELLNSVNEYINSNQKIIDLFQQCYLAFYLPSNVFSHFVNGKNIAEISKLKMMFRFLENFGILLGKFEVLMIEQNNENLKRGIYYSILDELGFSIENLKLYTLSKSETIERVFDYETIYQIYSLNKYMKKLYTTKYNDKFMRYNISIKLDENLDNMIPIRINDLRVYYTSFKKEQKKLLNEYKFWSFFNEVEVDVDDSDDISIGDLF